MAVARIKGAKTPGDEQGRARRGIPGPLIGCVPVI
jgi:hypothetical protein